MNKKVLSLLLCGLLVMPLAGCELRINGKEIFSTEPEEKIEEKLPVEEEEQEEIIEHERKYTDEQVVRAVNVGTYTLTINTTGEEIEYTIEEVINGLYADPLYVVSYLSDVDQYKVMITDNGTGRYITVVIDETSLAIKQLCEDNDVYEEDEANNKLAQMVYDNIYLKNKGNGVEAEKKNEQQNKQKEVPQGKCIYCNGPLKDSDKKSVCSSCKNDPMAQSKGKHMESTAPYGRCPKCNAAHASEKDYQGDYCDDCFAKIKQEEYNEKHKYGDCIDCGVYLTKNQASSYGGRCPDCYAKHYGDNDTNMGSCDRCGDRVDLDHTNEGWGYSHLCSACTGELQMQESQQDATPWAG